MARTSSARTTSTVNSAHSSHSANYATNAINVNHSHSKNQQLQSPLQMQMQMTRKSYNTPGPSSSSSSSSSSSAHAATPSTSSSSSSGDSGKAASGNAGRDPSKGLNELDHLLGHFSNPVVVKKKDGKEKEKAKTKESQNITGGADVSSGIGVGGLVNSFGHVSIQQHHQQQQQQQQQLDPSSPFLVSQPSSASATFFSSFNSNLRSDIGLATAGGVNGSFQQNPDLHSVQIVQNNNPTNDLNKNNLSGYGTSMGYIENQKQQQQQQQLYHLTPTDLQEIQETFTKLSQSLLYPVSNPPSSSSTSTTTATSATTTTTTTTTTTGGFNLGDSRLKMVVSVSALQGLMVTLAEMWRSSSQQTQNSIQQQHTKQQMEILAPLVSQVSHSVQHLLRGILNSIDGTGIRNIELSGLTKLKVAMEKLQKKCEELRKGLDFMMMTTMMMMMDQAGGFVGGGGVASVGVGGDEVLSGISMGLVKTLKVLERLGKVWSCLEGLRLSSAIRMEAEGSQQQHQNEKEMTSGAVSNDGVFPHTYLFLFYFYFYFIIFTMVLVELKFPNDYILIHVI
jgi:hypothetical protein